MLLVYNSGTIIEGNWSGPEGDVNYPSYGTGQGTIRTAISLSDDGATSDCGVFWTGDDYIDEVPRYPGGNIEFKNVSNEHFDGIALNIPTVIKFNDFNVPCDQINELVSPGESDNVHTRKIILRGNIPNIYGIKYEVFTDIYKTLEQVLGSNLLTPNGYFKNKKTLPTITNISINDIVAIIIFDLCDK